MLKLLKPWDSQPQDSVHPADEFGDMAWSWLGSTRIQNAGQYGGHWTQVGAPAAEPTAQGIAQYSPAYATENRYTGATLNPSTLDWPGVTVVSTFIPVAHSTGEFPGIASCIEIGNFFNGFILSSEYTSSTLKVAWRTTSSTALLSSTITAGVPTVAVATWDKATQRLLVFQNGVLLSDTSSANAVAWPNVSALMSVLGFVRSGASRMTPFRVSSVAVLPRALTQDRRYEIARQPWQLFAPRSIWVPVSDAGGSVTGTSATTNANDTSSASGTTTVVGTSATTNANDTATASGVVGSAVTGTSATTNANDTSSASGTTTVTGTVAYSNANDSAAATGWAGAVSGTATVTNANDTAQASGTAEGGATDTHDGFWSREWAKLRKREEKKPTIAEVVEIVKESPQVLEVVRAEVVRKYPQVDYATVRENVQLQRFIAKQLIEAAEEEDDIETLLLMA